MVCMFYVLLCSLFKYFTICSFVSVGIVLYSVCFRSWMFLNGMYYTTSSTCRCQNGRYCMCSCSQVSPICPGNSLTFLFSLSLHPCDRHSRIVDYTLPMDLMANSLYYFENLFYFLGTCLSLDLSLTSTRWCWWFLNCSKFSGMCSHTGSARITWSSYLTQSEHQVGLMIL